MNICHVCSSLSEASVNRRSRWPLLNFYVLCSRLWLFLIDQKVLFPKPAGSVWYSWERVLSFTSAEPALHTSVQIKDGGSNSCRGGALQRPSFMCFIIRQLISKQLFNGDGAQLHMPRVQKDNMDDVGSLSLHLYAIFTSNQSSLPLLAVSWEESDRKYGKIKSESDMQERSPAGTKLAMLPLCGMRSNLAQHYKKIYHKLSQVIRKYCTICSWVLHFLIFHLGWNISQSSFLFICECNI